jgi:ribosomal protein L31
MPNDDKSSHGFWPGELKIVAQNISNNIYLFTSKYNIKSNVQKIYNLYTYQDFIL